MPVTNLLIELCASFLEVNHNFGGGESGITPRGRKGDGGIPGEDGGEAPKIGHSRKPHGSL